MAFRSLSISMRSRPSCPVDPFRSSKRKAGPVKPEPRKRGEGVRFQLEGRPPTRAIIVHVDFKDRARPGTAARRPERRLEEAVELAKAIDLEIAAALIVPLARAKPATL